MDIVGPFPLAPGQLKFLIVGVDYFTKWVEAEAVSRITVDIIKKFYWKKIICRFRLRKYFVTDNGTQFVSARVVDFCTQLGIQIKFVLVIHPQANGQAEAANEVILNDIKRKLEAAKGLWAEQVHEVSAILLLLKFSLNLLQRIFTTPVFFTLGQNILGKKKVLWSYYTTPHSTTKETPFTMVYGVDAMLPVEIHTPTWRRDNFMEEGKVHTYV